MANTRSAFKRRKVVCVPQAAGDHVKQGWYCQLECGPSTSATGRQALGASVESSNYDLSERGPVYPSRSALG